MRPKSASQYLLFLIFLSGMLWSQTPQITSVPAADANDFITVCEGDTLEFTATGGGVYQQLWDYAFLLIKSGSGTPTVLQSRSSSHTFKAVVNQSSPTLETGDIVFARVWSSLSSPSFYKETKLLSIQVHSFEIPTLYDDTIGHRYCMGDSINFDVLPTNGLQYDFYVNGELKKSSTETNFTLSDIDQGQVEVAVNVHYQNCIGKSSLLLIESPIIHPGSIMFEAPFTGENVIEVCENESLPAFISKIPGQLNAVDLSSSDPQYQWERSTDRLNWLPIDHTGESYQSQKLSTTTYFQRTVRSSGGGIHGNQSEQSSNILQISVTQALNGGQFNTAKEIVCYNSRPASLVIENASIGGNYQYQWQSSLNGIHFSNIDEFGQEATYQPPPLQRTTYFKRIMYSADTQCKGESTVFEVEVLPEETPFTTKGLLFESTSTTPTTVPQKVISPSCLNDFKGQIGVQILGGVVPYQVEWYFYDADQSRWQTQPEFSNLTRIGGLSPGIYKIQVQSDLNQCYLNTPTHPHVFFEELFVVEEAPKIQYVEGPYLDDNLCDLHAGKLTIHLSNPSEYEYTVLYNGHVINEVQKIINETIEILQINISEPSREGQLQLLDSNGCSLFEWKVTIDPIVRVDFSFNSTTSGDRFFEPREHIEFTNTSIGSYFE